MIDNSDQLRFGENGELEESEEEEQTTKNVGDDGEPTGRFQTDARYNIFDVSSLLQKSVRRSDEELAAWAAWELCRSGYDRMFWKRILTIATEDTSVESGVTSQVRSLYRLGTGQVDTVDSWSADGERGRVCALRAAVVCAQAQSSRLCDYLNNTFERIAEERVNAAEEGRDPRYDFPAGNLEPDDQHDVIFDMHTASGSGRGRGYGHFLTHSSRTDSISDLEKRCKRINMELVEKASDTDASFSKTEYEHALSATDPDDAWSEPDLSQETLDSK